MMLKEEKPVMLGGRREGRMLNEREKERGEEERNEDV